MAFLRLLVTISLTYIIAAALPLDDDSGNDSQTAINYRLPDNVVPVHYNIKLIPYIVEDNFTFDGETNIDIVIRQATRNLCLHAFELTINEKATLLVNSEGVGSTPKAHNYDNITQMLDLNFEEDLLPGHYTLNIKFIGILNNVADGFFRTSYINEDDVKVWLAVTHFEATSARRAFPCWDEPALKATFNISIKHYRNYTALSNMPALAPLDENHEDDMIWTHFDTTPVMSTYLVAFVVSDYVRVPSTDETINAWTRPQLVPHMKFAQQIAQQSGELLTKYTNSTDKVPKMDHVSSPVFNAGAMENWGLIIYREGEMKYDEKRDTTKHKHRVAVVAAHEMAHQWFGNVVSPLWWTHVWLNEGFASFMEAYILDKMFEDWRMMDLMVINKQHYSFFFDTEKQMMPITFEVNSPEEIESLFQMSSYSKAPVILRMLQHIITEQVFQHGLIRYLNTHQFSSATSDDLWDAFQAALDESDVPHDGYKLKDVMDTWIKQRHYPVVQVIRDYDTGEVVLKQEHFRTNTEKNKTTIDKHKWWIPITFTTQSNPDFNNTVPTHWLRPQVENITISGIDSNDWIMVNLQQTGYYLVNYDEKNWRKIIEYLNSDDYTKIHVLNRVQLINGASQLLSADQINLSTFLGIVNYLERETQYIPWSTMFDFLSDISIVFKMPGGESLKEALFKMVNNLVENVGYEENPSDNDFTKLKRVEALKWACDFGHPECRRMATRKLEEHLANLETDEVQPNLKEWTLCSGMMNASLSSWNKMMDIFINDSDDTILSYLACSENPEILINYLNVNDSVADNDIYLAIYELVMEKHADKDSICDYALANLEQMVSRGMDIEDTLLNIINHVHSKQKLDKINEFVKNNYKENQKLLENIQTEMDDRLAELQFYQKLINATIGD